MCVAFAVPASSNQAPAGTMSSVYDLGPFPLHTERAHWRTPPRFVAFRSIGAATDRPTTLLDSCELETISDLVRDLYDVEWLVHWGNERFLTRVLTPLQTSRWHIRYDRCCMTVHDPDLHALATRLENNLSSVPVEYHYWSPEVVLIIDNWRILHGRGMSQHEDFGRTLERIVIP
jgi:hypothetical protein